MMDFIIDFFNFIGSLICHQLPERTIFLDGISLPVCARDTGIYLGIFTGMLIIILLGRFDSDMTPGLPITVLLCLFMLPMLIDGFGSYLGFFSSNNVTRLLTGSAFGLAIPFFLIPTANFKVYASNKRNVLKNPLEFAAALALTALLCAAVLSGKVLPYLAIASLIAASFIFLIGRIAYTMIVILRPAMKRKLYATAGATLCILSVLYVISSCILKPLKAMLIK